MDHGEFRLVAGRDGRDAVLKIVGEIDLATAPRVAAAFEDLDGATEIRVDLSEVTFLDASGLSVFVRASLNAERRAGGITFEGLAPIVRKVFVISGLAHLLDRRG